MDQNIIKHDTRNWQQKAEVMIIDSQISYEHASDLVQDIIAFRKKIERHYKPAIEAAKKAKAAADLSRKEAIRTQDTHVDPVKEVEKVLQRKIRQYEDARAETERQEKAAAELKAKELTEKAEEKIWEGDDEEAEELLDKADNQELIAKDVVGSTISKVAGSGIRRDWEAIVVDEMAIPRAYLMPDMVRIRAEVRRYKEDTQIPGIKAQVKEI